MTLVIWVTKSSNYLRIQVIRDYILQYLFVLFLDVYITSRRTWHSFRSKIPRTWSRGKFFFCFPTGEIDGKPLRRSFFLTMWNCVLNAYSTKTHFFRVIFLEILPAIYSYKWYGVILLTLLTARPLFKNSLFRGCKF